MLICVINMPSKMKNASKNDFYVSKNIVEKSIFALGSRKVLPENVFMSIARVFIGQ